MKSYSLINYFDVWGNKKDGYEINNQCIEFSDLIIVDSATNKDIVKYLYDIGFLSTHDMRRIDVINHGDLIEVYSKKDAMPICALLTN
jgi:hypothetical protein